MCYVLLRDTVNMHNLRCLVKLSDTKDYDIIYIFYIYFPSIYTSLFTVDGVCQIDDIQIAASGSEVNVRDQRLSTINYNTCIEKFYDQFDAVPANGPRRRCCVLVRG